MDSRNGGSFQKMQHLLALDALTAYQIIINATKYIQMQVSINLGLALCKMEYL